MDTVFQDETIWMPQKKIAQLFDVDRTVVTKHIKNIFETGELEEKSNVQKMHFSHSDKPIKGDGDSMTTLNSIKLLRNLRPLLRPLLFT